MWKVTIEVSRLSRLKGSSGQMSETKLEIVTIEVSRLSRLKASIHWWMTTRLPWLQ